MRKDKRFLLVAMLIGIILMCLSFRFYGYVNTWHLWNLPANPLPFLDLRLITGGAESYAAGSDPAVIDLYDPEHRIFNYPKVWYLILASGINQSWTVPIGVVTIGLFLWSVYLFPGKLSGLSTFYLLLALISPAMMLAIERVNVDMFFFISMTVGLLLLDVSAVASFVILALGILFKIIPILGAGYFMDGENSSTLKYVLAAILFTALYFVLTLRDMIFIFSTTLKGYDTSYGVGVLPAYLRLLVAMHELKVGQPGFYGAIFSINRIFLRLPFLPYLVAFLILVICSFWGIRRRGEFQYTDLRNLRAFWMGAGIYVGTFFIGNNWDYRLMFLLFTLPQLADWATQRIGRSTPVLWVTVSALFLSLWYLVLKAITDRYMFLGEFAYPMVDEIVNWILFSGLIYFYAFSLPDWVFSEGKLLLSRVFLVRKPVP